MNSEKQKTAAKIAIGVIFGLGVVVGLVLQYLFTVGVGLRAVL